MMKSRGFEQLRVYALAEQLADEIWPMVQRWNAFARNTVGGQLVRAVDSVGANIAEGSGRGACQDNRRFVRMARASLFEARHWLRRAYRRQFLTMAQVTSLKSLIEQLGPKLNAYLKSIGPTNDQ
jgi:four helix bundle protein